MAEERGAEERGAEALVVDMDLERGERGGLMGAGPRLVEPTLAVPTLATAVPMAVVSAASPAAAATAATAAAAAAAYVLPEDDSCALCLCECVPLGSELVRPRTSTRVCGACLLRFSASFTVGRHPDRGVEVGLRHPVTRELLCEGDVERVLYALNGGPYCFIAVGLGRARVSDGVCPRGAVWRGGAWRGDEDGA